MLSFFPRGVLDEILNLIESVSEEFPSYSAIRPPVNIFKHFLQNCWVSKVKSFKAEFLMEPHWDAGTDLLAGSGPYDQAG